MGFDWEIPYPGLRVEERQAAWTINNIGDDVAPSGTEIGTATITSRPGPKALTPVATITNPLSIDRDVEGHTSHPMTYPLSWSGQEPGSYTLTVVIGPATAEVYYRANEWGQCELDTY